MMVETESHPRFAWPIRHAKIIGIRVPVSYRYCAKPSTMGEASKPGSQRGSLFLSLVGARYQRVSSGFKDGTLGSGLGKQNS